MESRNRKSYNKSPKKPQHLVLIPFVSKKFENCFLATQVR